MSSLPWWCMGFLFFGEFFLPGKNMVTVFYEEAHACGTETSFLGRPLSVEIAEHSSELAVGQHERFVDFANRARTFLAAEPRTLRLSDTLISICGLPSRQACAMQDLRVWAGKNKRIGIFLDPARTSAVQVFVDGVNVVTDTAASFVLEKQNYIAPTQCWIDGCRETSCLVRPFTSCRTLDFAVWPRRCAPILIRDAALNRDLDPNACAFDYGLRNGARLLVGTLRRFRRHEWKFTSPRDILQLKHQLEGIFGFRADQLHLFLEGGAELADSWHGFESHMCFEVRRDVPYAGTFLRHEDSTTTHTSSMRQRFHADAASSSDAYEPWCIRARLTIAWWRPHRFRTLIVALCAFLALRKRKKLRR